MRLIYSTFVCFGMTTVAVFAIPFVLGNKKIEGIVVDAVWRNDINLETVVANERGKKNKEFISTIKSHWVIILKDVNGLNNNEKTNLSFAFFTHKPIDHFRGNYFNRNKDKFDNGQWLYIHVPGNKDWPVKIGSSIQIIDYNLYSTDGASDIKIKSIAIDGVVYNYEAERDVPEK